MSQREASRIKDADNHCLLTMDATSFLSLLYNVAMGGL